MSRYGRLSVFLMGLFLFSSLPSIAAGDENAPKADDLPNIRKNGELKILMTASEELDALPRRVSPRDYDRGLLMCVAERLALRLKFVFKERFEDLIPALLAGEGDVIADNLAIYEDRAKIISYTMPICKIHDQIITSSRNKKVNRDSDLSGRTLHYEKGTGYIKSLEKLKKEIPSIKIEEAPEGIDTETLMHMVAMGKYELAISDTNYTESFQTYRDDIKTIYTFPEMQYTAWGMRHESNALRMIADNVIKENLDDYGKPIMKGDLDAIMKRKVLRILTRNNPICYFIHKGKIMGFEYELAAEFAKRLGLYPVIIVPPNWSNLIPWLADGKGDIVAAAVTKTEKRLKNPDISFCEPYCVNINKIVGRVSEKPFSSVDDLKGRKVALRKNSAYWETMQKLKKEGLDVELVPVSEGLETFEIIDKVAKGEYDLTVADQYILKLEMMRRNDIAELFSIGPEERYCWVVRRESPKLKNAVDDFFKKEYKGVFYNTVFNRYFKNPKIMLEQNLVSSDKVRISDYDPYIKKYSARYDVHWLLIASQIFQESRFNPRVVSSAGAIGLMQVEPATGLEMGFGDVKKDEDNIHAGIKYLYRQKNKIREKIHEKDKLCFALASYNAGYGHVLDARRLAEKLELDPCRWFDNVEKCMLLLEKPEYAKSAKYGYCRGSEPVKYVREILLRYKLYLEAEEDLKQKPAHDANLP